MASVKRNIIANYGGSFWSALMGLAFVPLYIKLMGIEAYGLVGFFGTLVSLFSILDMGLSATLSREMARRSSLTEQEATTRDLLRTIETIYWGVAVIVGAAVILLSFPIARYWVNPEKLTIADVQQAVMIMGLVVVFRWPFGMYQGGLMGLQRQVLVNIINGVSATLRGLGAVLVLWLISPTIQAFFLFQIIVSGLETLIMAFFLWRSLPRSVERAVFTKSILSEIWAFAGGMMGISVVILILTQTDKLLLSKLLPLEMYGYYMLAWTVAGALYKVITPIFVALYPKFAQLVATNDTKGLTELYHKSCQFMSVIVLPVAMVLVFFSYQVLFIWTGDANIADKTYLVVSLLVVGTACNAMMNIPYAVQLAYGWTSLTFWVNVVSIIVLIPSLLVLVSFYGMVGGAIVWAALNIGYALIALPIMHRRILKGELLRWYAADFGPILVSSVVVVLAGRVVIGEQLEPFTLIALLGCLAGGAFLGSILAAPDVRVSASAMVVGLWSEVQKRIVHLSV